tara:strand:+ start:2949 stop:3263 length:315 start_codon:yes stop_codon:yes gene_type:complete
MSDKKSEKQIESEKKYKKYYEKNPIRFLFMDDINKSGKKPRGRGELKKQKERIKQYLKDTNQRPMEPSFGIEINPDLKSKGGSVKKYSRGGGAAVQGTKFKGSY